MEQARFNEMVKLFEQATDRKKQPLNMHYLLIKKNKQTFMHAFDGKEGPSDIRSISKTVLTIFLGVLIRLGEASKYPKINEDTYIYPIIQGAIQLTNTGNLEQLKKVQIKHLLTHSVGFDRVLLMRDDIKEMDPFQYVDYIVNSPIVHEPGTQYLYSNAGFYLLAVTLQELLQENLLQVMDREFFNPLGITDYKWEMYGKYIAGATRLWLLPEDLLKIGELLLAEGRLEGRDYFTKAWLKKMRTPRFYTEKVDTPGATFRRHAYGYGIWLPKEDFYFGHGTDGQMLAVLPEKELIVLTLADQRDLRPIERLIDQIITEK